ncbi:MAG: beta-N-acetylhexosaminidase [Enterobacteriaceae bacterium]
MATVGCTYKKETQQQLVDRLSQQLQVNYQIVDNQGADNGLPCAQLGADWGACNRSILTLANEGSEVKRKDWAIYFHSIRQILEVENKQYRVTHITGDLHKLEPTSKFAGIAAGEKVEIPLIGEYWQLFETDVMPRWYVTSGDAQPKVIANTDTEQLRDFVAPIEGDLWKRTRDDHNILMTSSSRYDKNQDTRLLPAQALRGQILPTPKEVKLFKDDAWLGQGIRLDRSLLSPEQADSIIARFDRLGIAERQKGFPIYTSIRSLNFKDEMAVPGAYTLNINKDSAHVIGYDETGVYYGLQSLLSLVPAQGAPRIATLYAKDAPRFEYRGMFLDVARNFHSKEAVLRLLDQMAAYKLNKFHFHLTDDEGWRLEIPGLPELTEVGSKRCHDLSETQCLLPQLGSGPDSNNNGSGFFTRADYIEIVKYANARHIEVIPEIDMPAHARAAVVSMEARYKRLADERRYEEAEEYRLLDPSDNSNTTSVQFYDRRSYLNPCLDSSKRFADKVITEVAAMHKEAGAPLQTWHYGGDEAKNIRLGAGYQDRGVANPDPGKGLIDLGREDQPWSRSPVCQTKIRKGEIANIESLPGYFAVEVSKTLQNNGIERMQAWQDGLKNVTDAKAFATKHVAVNFWDTLYWGGASSVNDWAAKGFEVIISNPDYVYLDMPYEVNPLERGYYWATRFNDERKIFAFAPNNLPQNAETSLDRDGNAFEAQGDKAWPGAYGLSAQSWSETVRTDGQMEYMIYPRLLAVAERSWHQGKWEQPYEAGKRYQAGQTHLVDGELLLRDWQRFANLLGQRELEKNGIAYRLPVLGGRIANGLLKANSALPGVTIQYSEDGGNSWQRYEIIKGKYPRVSGDVLLRTASKEGTSFSRVTEVKY